MFSLLVHCEPREEDALTAPLWEWECAGIEEVPGGFRAFFPDHVEFDVLRAALRRDPVSVRQEDSTDWAQVARDAFPPLLIGKRLFLAPTWHDEPAPPGRLRLEILPGRACGTGYHPCTQMCLEAMERYLHPGDSVLDVGAGSGILCDAAALLGAGFIAGCDIDPDAVTVARERVRAPLFVGSVDAVHGASFDLIVANIGAWVLEDLAEEFARVRKPESTLIVSGFEELEMPQGLIVREVLRQENWVCLVF